MLISVVNHTKGKLSDELVQEGIRAVDRQIAHDFRPHWDFGAELRLEGAIGNTPDQEKRPEPRGDAILNPGGYIGFYNAENREHETFALKGDARARQRLKIKSKAQLTRRSMRYKLGVSYPERVESAPRHTGGAASASAFDPASRRRGDRSGTDPSRPGRGLT